MKVKIFADGADLKSMAELYDNPVIQGFTTNPSILKKAGVKDYRTFAKEVLSIIKYKPISFEVFADTYDDMKRQALEIASWGNNVNVKIPITYTNGNPTTPLIHDLSKAGVKLNVTAIMTNQQVIEARDALGRDFPPSFISIFAGRIADTGIDPLPIMKQARWDTTTYPVQLIWASPRELLNIVHADSVSCHIITVTPDILKKLPMIGYDLDQLSLDTVKMFYNDAQLAGYTL
jgi:transaldolase